MKKFEYKMLLLRDAETWIEAGEMIAGFNPKLLGKPVSLKFADELGSEGWEMFNVVTHHTHGSGGGSSVFFLKGKFHRLREHFN